MSNLALFLLMFAGGLAAIIQPSINARLAEKVGFVESAFISFLVGTLTLLVLVGLFGRGHLRGVVDASWWELTGGCLGALFVSLTILAVPRIGPPATMGAAIAAQLTGGLILDHYGWFGFRGFPMDLRRIAGVVLLMIGAALLLRR
ncbi:MAG: DMT family transporter [Deltaproteobacteria bacterium]|nr:DMT family transporter [Deltaproteobacteria bacterium]